MPSDDVSAAVLEALGLWTQGNQQGAVDRIRALADAGEPSPLALIAWFFSQMGEPRWREGVPYAERAIDKGMYWAAPQYIGQVLNDPALRQNASRFFTAAVASGWQGDPIAHAMGPYQQGDQQTALALIGLAEGPWPWPAALEDFIDRARGKSEELAAAAGDVEVRRSEATSAIDAARERVELQANTLSTRTEQLTELLEQVTNASVQTYFDAEAKAYDEEARRLWRWGVSVLGAAAVFAALPIVIYYIGQIAGTGWFKDQNLVAAHFAPAVAAAAFAGVLLARARGRDRARQRARDLSVALGTMFVYSEQISDDGEKQRFVHEMGRTVIEAFLRQDSSGSDAGDGRSLLAELTRQH